MRNILLLIIIMFLYLIMSLQDGIKIDNLKFQNMINIDKVYIKLNSKLTLKIKEVDIQSSNDPVELSNIDTIFDRVKFVFNFFELIEIDKILFKDNTYKISFVDNALYIINNKFEILLELRREENIIKANIPLLYINKEDINIWSKLEYDLNNNNIFVNGNFRAYGINGKFRVDKIENRVTLNVYDTNSSNISTVVNRIKLKPKIKDWIAKRSQASFYNLIDFNISGDIIDKKFKVDLDSINAKLYANNVSVKFRDGVPPVKTKFLKVFYKGRGLEFNLTKLTYLDKNIDYSRVTIEDIGGKNPYLNIYLNVKTPFDNKIAKILKGYRVNIPIKQLRGSTKAKVYIGVGLKSKKVEVKGDFDLSKGIVSIKKLKLKVKKGHIKYANKKVKLNNIILKSNRYSGVLNGNVDIKKHIATLYLKKLDISYPKLEAHNLKLPFTINYKNFIVDIPSLKTEIYKENNKMVFDFEDILKIRKYIKELQEIDGGKVKITTKDFEKFDIDGQIKRNNCFMYEDMGICNTIIPINGEFYKSNLTLGLFNNKIIYKSSNDSLSVKNIHIDLNKLIESRKSNSQNNSSEFRKFGIVGENSQIKYDKYKLLTDKYNISIDKDNLIFRGYSGNKTIYLEKNKNIISIDAKDIDDKILHPLINFNSLKGGKYTLYLDGVIDGKIDGEIRIVGGILAKFKTYNNIVAFANTIPALITLSKPGFNDDGYKIKEGVVDYSIDKNILRFKSIKIVGESSTIIGAGTINLKTKKIKIDLAVQVAREIGSIISKIPLVGYILLGDGKSMAIGLSIRGDLKNPKVDTHTIKNMVELPFGILERLLKAPSNLLHQKK